MALDPERLYDAAVQILDAVTTAHAAAVVAALPAVIKPLPDRQYVHVGEPAHDCEQVTVSFSALRHGTVNVEYVEAFVAAVPRVAEFAIEIVRCVPTEETPTVEALDGSAHEQMRDALIVLRGLQEAHAEKGLTLEGCGGAAIGRAEPIAGVGTQGDFGGIRIPVTVAL